MKILVLSGGSGNDSLIRGLKKLYPSVDVKVLVNAYDAGKSTGVCRKVTNTLGVSDIRKNHIRMYESLSKFPDKKILEFYNERYDFTEGHECEEICKKLSEWGLTQLVDYVSMFFSIPTAQHYIYKDFNVSNIVYAMMFSHLGYEKTNSIFCELLGIPDFLILNSFDNVYIQAITQSGKVIEDEGDIVEYCNPHDMIVKMQYVGENNQQLNPSAIEAINEADYIVISTGTFWISIYPTLQYGDLYKYINKSKAKKLWAINNECDKDSYGVSSNQFIQFFEDLGLNLDDFVILENLDANGLLRLENDNKHTLFRSMGNNKGKHNPDKYAAEILKFYYGITSLDAYSHVLIDFDDTLWARNASTTEPLLLHYSLDNLSLLNNSDKYTIISGNSFDSIKNKLTSVYGTNLDRFDVDVWADANTNCYRKGELVRQLKEFTIPDEYVVSIATFLACNYGIHPDGMKSGNSTTYIKIKPLDSLTRNILVDYLNTCILPSLSCNQCKAVATGNTTVDIIHVNNNKAKLLEVLDCVKGNVLYIGDEVNVGNDADIAHNCSTHINTSGVEETHCILELLNNQ